MLHRSQLSCIQDPTKDVKITLQNTAILHLCNQHQYSTQDICTCCQCMSHHIQSLKCSRHSDDTQHTFLTEGGIHRPRNTEQEIKIELYILIHSHSESLQHYEYLHFPFQHSPPQRAEHSSEVEQNPSYWRKTDYFM